MIKFLRTNTVAMWILTALRIYLGYMWLMDGFHKVTGGFDATGFIQNAIKNPVVGPEGNQVFTTYTTILKDFVAPNQSFFNIVVAWGELFVGLGLIFGTFTILAAFFGMVMNFSYVMAGTVSVNPIYIILEILILMAGYNAAKIGLDRWITPFVRNKVSFLKEDTGFFSSDVHLQHH